MITANNDMLSIGLIRDYDPATIDKDVLRKLIIKETEMIKCGLSGAHYEMNHPETYTSHLGSTFCDKIDYATFYAERLQQLSNAIAVYRSLK